jgi:hypothetical protein
MLLSAVMAPLSFNQEKHINVHVLLAGTSSGKVGPFITDVVQVSRFFGKEETECV